MTDQAAVLRDMVKEGENSGCDDSRTRIIAVGSGKGGVGKTSITVNLGLALQQMDKKVLIMDVDLGMANVDIMLGLTPRYNLSHILQGKCSFEDALMEGPDRLNILPGTSGVEDLVNISYREVGRLLEACARMEEEYDIILLDIGAGVHNSIINFLMASDETLVILTPEPTAIMDAYSLVKILSSRDYGNKVGLIVNQVDSEKEAEKVGSRMSKVIHQYLDFSIKFQAYIPYDHNVQKAVKKQDPVMTLYPDCSAGIAINKLACKLIDREEEKEARGMKGFVYRVIGLFNR